VEVTKDDNNEIKYFTLEDIAKHDGVQESTVWIIIKDNVYDVTPYLDEHPGGGELITEWAGKDGTKEFDNFGHSTDAKKDLKQFKIGEVTEEQRKKKTKKTEKNQVEKLKPPKIKNSPDVYARRTCISIITCGICS